MVRKPRRPRAAGQKLFTSVAMVTVTAAVVAGAGITGLVVLWRAVTGMKEFTVQPHALTSRSKWIKPDSFHEEWIGREIIFSREITEDTLLHIDDVHRLPIPYNPEWVSIDVRYDNPAGGEILLIEGTLCHDCVPEPSTFALLICGALGLLAWLWRRRS